MKIAHVVGTFPPHVGGMGTVAKEESLRLVKKGHEVTVFTLAYPQTFYDDSKLPFRVVRMKPWLRWGDGGLVPQLLRQLKNFDIVHLHYPFYGGSEWVLMAKYLYKKKCIITYHMDAAPVGWWKQKLQAVYDALTPLALFRRAERVIVVDKEHFAHSRFYRIIKQDKVREIYNGVDTKVFEPRPVDWNRLGLTAVEHKKIFLFVGNLVPFKRFDLLLEALKQLNDKEVVVIVVGGGYALPEYQAQVKKLGLESQVYFQGYCDDPRKLAEYYSAEQALVVPADRADSFSLVALEAMASGCPVIVSDLPGVWTRIEAGSDGWVFEKGAVEALVTGMRQAVALSKDDRVKMGERVRKKVEARYRWGDHMAKLEQVYNEVGSG